MPPYADDLYAADDSDDESFSEELSPTDGYFNQRDQSRNVLISDPSIGSSTADSKAREAREEAEALERTIGSHRASTTTDIPLSPLPPSQPPQPFLPAPSDLGAGTTLYTRTYPITSTYSPSPQGLRQDSYSEASPLLYSTAPPAYSPSSSSSRGHQRNYGTASDNHLEEGRLAPFREPESMGQPQYSDNNQAPLIRGPVISRKRKFVQRAILFLAALALVASFISATVNSATGPGKNRTSQPKKPIDSQPPRVPQPPADPEQPMDPQPPINPEPIDAGEPYCPSATYVLWTNNYPFNFNEEGHLTITQSTHKSHDGVEVQTAGEIRVRRLPENSPYTNGYVTSDVRASDPNIDVEQRNPYGDTFMRISSPKTTQRTSSNAMERPCVSIELTLWVPDTAKLTTLRLEAQTLTVRLLPDVTAHIADETYIKTISGKIVFPPSSGNAKAKSLGLPNLPKKPWWLPNIPGLPKFPFSSEPSEKRKSPGDITPPKLFPLPGSPESVPEEHPGIFTSRKQYIETTSGSIQGTFTLYDYLHISSVSGSFHISVLPQDEDPKAPAAAELFLHTISGSIEGYFPFHNDATSASQDAIQIPDREYRTHVDSSSGHLKGRFLLGNHASFKSHSGSISLDMLDGYTKTIKGSDGYREFSTETMSGSTRVEISNSAFGDDATTSQSSNSAEISIEETKRKEAIRNLASNHRGTSGSVQLYYPSAWEGTIVATSVSGSLKVAGEGVVIDNDRRNDWVNKEIRAHKGDDVGNGKGSQLSVSELSGSTQILFGGHGGT